MCGGCSLRVLPDARQFPARELQRRLWNPQARRVGDAEPHQVRGRRPARRLLERDADAQPHVRQRQLRRVVWLERLVRVRVVHARVTLAATVSAATAAFTATTAA